MEGILHRISNGIHTNTIYAYQPIGSLIKILQKKCTMLDGLQFKQLSVSRTLATQAQTVGQYKQLVMAMTGLNWGVGVRGMMELLDRVRNGLYKPKNFTKEERSCGLLFLHLGGAHVASLAHQTLGVPTLSTLCYGSSTITLLSPSVGFPTRSEIQGNIQAAFKNLSGSGACGYILMIDEIKVEERMQWDPSTNKILGLCWEHTEHVGLDFCSMSDVKALVHDILCGKLHHASEATVFSIGACNTESSTIGYGESHQGSALTTLTQKRLLDPKSELHVLLGKLRLLNLLVGNNDITTDKDPKHSGVMINSFIVTPALLHFHFRANNMPPHCILYLLNPTDHQDEVWSLPPPAPTDKPSFVAARDALQMLGSLFRHLVLPFVQVSLSLHEQLVHLSAAAHLAMFLFTAKSAQSKAMPSLTFKDLVLLVKNTYFCVAKAKIYTPDGDFYLILNGTDQLESTFGVVRSMVGNDTNADVLTPGYCLSHAIECLNIFLEHPAWDRSPRHLHLCRIEDGNGDVLSKSDHITPASWKGNVNVHNVSLVTTWNLGHALLELENQGHDMEFPFGQVTEGLKEPEDGDCKQDDDSDQIHLTPETADGTTSLTAQDVTALISSLTLGEGEGPLLDLEDHTSIETSCDG
ncbi:hypothetical protein EDB86DRAFT_3066228 [Lactarius hatsudake]|nr:hypothetical protein EDB86DRAFT_3066228 [Lactarius hatsudake]